MISWRSDVMTPRRERVSLGGSGPWKAGFAQSVQVVHTKRVPQDKGKLRDLLALLAELQQGRLAGALVEEIGYVLQCAAVVLRDRLDGRLLHVAGIERVDVAVGTGEAAVVLLLGDIRGSGGGLGVVLVVGLLVDPGRVGLGILVMSVDMRVRHHLGGLTMAVSR